MRHPISRFVCLIRAYHLVLDLIIEISYNTVAISVVYTKIRPTTLLKMVVRSAWAGGIRVMTRKLAQSIAFKNRRNERPETDLNGRRENNRELSMIMSNLRMTYPRLFHTLLGVVFPLMLLICVAMLCGLFLAMVEREGELISNNASIASNFQQRHKVQQSVDTIRKTYDDCLLDFVDLNPVDNSELKSFMDECTSAGVSESQQLVDDLNNETEKTLEDALTFDWNVCSEDGTKVKAYEQWDYIYGEWMGSYTELYNRNLSEGLDESESFSRAIENATGTSKCKLHSAGGAMFWFTVMT